MEILVENRFEGSFHAETIYFRSHISVIELKDKRETLPQEVSNASITHSHRFNNSLWGICHLVKIISASSAKASQ